MRGRDFLDIVGVLKPVESEASLRTRVGRMYYAAYLEARGWCEIHLGYQRVKLGREPADVQRMLAAIDSDIADNLAFLRGYRNTADYDLNVSSETLLMQHADALDRVNVVIGLLETLEPPLSEPESTPEP
ncbi:MAG TPA: hypothetical protein VD767_10140 [Thermomicrobiales bacterium]|nr:hypothetical protein [Thermomicrobiales bacterium]